MTAILVANGSEHLGAPCLVDQQGWCFFHEMIRHPGGEFPGSLRFGQGSDPVKPAARRGEQPFLFDGQLR